MHYECVRLCLFECVECVCCVLFTLQLECVLMEQRVLLVSNDYEALTAVGEALTALIFPFVWSHVYVPLLPSQLTEYLQAPVPFIMGIPTNVLLNTDLTEISTTCVLVDLEADDVRVCADQCRLVCCHHSCTVCCEVQIIMPAQFELPGGGEVSEVPHFPAVIRHRLIKHLDAIVPPPSSPLVSPLKEETCTCSDTNTVLLSTASEEWTVQVRAAVLEVNYCCACG